MEASAKCVKCMEERRKSWENLLNHQNRLPFRPSTSLYTKVKPSNIPSHSVTHSEQSQKKRYGKKHRKKTLPLPPNDVLRTLLFLSTKQSCFARRPTTEWKRNFVLPFISLGSLHALVVLRFSHHFFHPAPQQSSRSAQWVSPAYLHIFMWINLWNIARLSMYDLLKLRKVWECRWVWAQHRSSV